MNINEMSISEILDEINKTIFLPDIQRKYVWKDEQILNFMDSLMRGYPIGTFLFWKVKKEIINKENHEIYNFIKNYHERDLYLNEKHGKFTENLEEYIYLVLDGQQRLTSLYISLLGTLARKLPNKRTSNNDAYPEKELYFNLMSPEKKENDKDNDNSIQYEFQFLTEMEASKDNKWYKVQDIFKYKDSKSLLKDLVGKKDNIIDNLIRLFTVLKIKNNENKNNASFVIEENSIDNVLDIFVRVNSGGTILSKTDLLFSTIVSKWSDARKEIDSLIKNINNIREKYKFNNDFIMRTCLYLLDKTIVLKVQNLKACVSDIEKNWNEISESIKKTIYLLSELGICDDNIISYNAIMPIIYYIFKGGNSNDNKNKEEIKKYFVLSQIKRIFGTASNYALTEIHKIIKNNCKDFPFDKLKEIKFTGNRTLKCDEQEIKDIIENEQKNKYTFLLLSLLYPNFKYGQEFFHQDHMHAHYFFQDKQIKNLELENKSKITKEKIKEWQEKRNKLPNLQILEGKENREKSKESLKDWLIRYSAENEPNIKYLPKGINYDDKFYELYNFDSFYEKRKELMLSELIKILL